MKRAACTIVSANYLHFAWTLAESFLRFHPEDEFHLLLVDLCPDGFVSRNPRVQMHEVQSLNLPNFRSLAFQFSVLELNTAVKPTFLKHLLALGLEKVIYFDPDISIYHSIATVYDALETASIVLTPHMLTPTPDAEHVYEREMLGTGAYNLGFAAVSSAKEGTRFLDWWEQRCLQYGFHDLRAGLFVDQKWIDLAHSFFSGICILRHPGCNVAYWNLRERNFIVDNGQHRVSSGLPLVFFHFSGYRPTVPNELSTKLRVPYGLDDDLRAFLVEYGERLKANGAETYQKYTYAFNSFSNGLLITSILRRLYSATIDHWAGEDPFDSTSRFFHAARRMGLLSKQDRSANYSASNLPVDDWRIRSINRTLFSLPRLIGGDRYSMLMKYLSYISILRHQGQLLTGKQRSAPIEYTERHP